MARRYHRAWLQKEERSQGETWVLFFRTVRNSDGKRVENKIPLARSETSPAKTVRGPKSSVDICISTRLTRDDR